MCDRIVVFDAPTRLVGRLVDIDILSAGAWSLAGAVADGLADAVPLADLQFAGEPRTELYDISLQTPSPQKAHG
jgi:hypothetical protein